jgi:TonB family protein
VPLYDLNPPPVYPRVARRRNYQGTVLLDVRVTAQGTVAEVKVARSSGYSVLDTSALSSVRNWRFEPARRGSRPIETWVQEYRLADLHILALDCQATGANPGKGHLLEIGWVSGSAAAEAVPDKQQVQSHLIRQPPETPIPPVVQRLTGITGAAMTEAVSPKTAWKLLDQAARATAARNQTVLYPTMIHRAQSPCKSSAPMPSPPGCCRSCPAGASGPWPVTSAIPCPNSSVAPPMRGPP